MTSSNGDIFRVTGSLWGKSSGHRWFPSQRPLKWGFDDLFDLHPNKHLSKWRDVGDWWRRRAQYGSTEMLQSSFPLHMHAFDTWGLGVFNWNNCTKQYKSCTFEFIYLDCELHDIFPVYKPIPIMWFKRTFKVYVLWCYCYAIRQIYHYQATVIYYSTVDSELLQYNCQRTPV